MDALDFQLTALVENQCSKAFARQDYLMGYECRICGTWHEKMPTCFGAELPAALTGDRHMPRYAADGRLVVAFRDMAHKSATRGSFVAWVGTYGDIVKGREGQYRVRLMDNTHGADCAYPGVEVLPDGTVVTTTYGHWEKGQKPFIASVRLKLEELDARAKALRAQK